MKNCKLIDSKTSQPIQIADMVAGSIFSFYTNKDKSYLEELKKSKRIDDVWPFR